MAFLWHGLTIAGHYTRSPTPKWQQLIEQGRGLIVEITGGDDQLYRGNLCYDPAKLSVIGSLTAWQKSYGHTMWLRQR